jgi:hypothetical protein
MVRYPVQHKNKHNGRLRISHSSSFVIWLRNIQYCPILAWLYGDALSILPFTRTVDLQHNNGLQREISIVVLFSILSKKWNLCFRVHCFFWHLFLLTNKLYHFYTYGSFFVALHRKPYVYKRKLQLIRTPFSSYHFRLLTLLPEL